MIDVKQMTLWWVVYCKSQDCGEIRSSREEDGRSEVCCLCSTHNVEVKATQKWECKECGQPVYQNEEPEKCENIITTSCEGCSQISTSVNVSEGSQCDCPGYIKAECAHTEFAQAI